MSLSTDQEYDSGTMQELTVGENKTQDEDVFMHEGFSVASEVLEVDEKK